LTQKLSRFQIKNAFVRDRAITADEKSSCSQAVPDSYVSEALVVQLTGRIEDQPDVHHYVNKNGMLGNEGPQILTIFIKTLSESPGGLQQYFLRGSIAGELIPPMVSREKNEAERVDIIIIFPCLQRATVPNRLLDPPLCLRLIRAQISTDNPHDAGQKTIAPLCPELTFVLPFSAYRVHRIKIRIRLHKALNLLLDKPYGVVEKLPVGFVNELNHASPALRVIIKSRAGALLPSRGMSVKVIIANNGPIRLEGDFGILDAQGQAFGLGGRTVISLCRCGHSENKPFCDGAHKRYGFESECAARELPAPLPKLAS
jgi:CDGSH-type Zn-finger protein